MSEQRQAEKAQPEVTTQLALDAIAWGRAPAYSPKGRPNLRVLCADGFSVSVQASSWHYAHDSSGGRAPYWSLEGEAEPAWPFISFEVGFPSVDPPSTWDEYDGGGVWAFVPRPLVEALLDEHGGAVGWTKQETSVNPTPPAAEHEHGKCCRALYCAHPKCCGYYGEPREA